MGEQRESEWNKYREQENKGNQEQDKKYSVQKWNRNGINYRVGENKGNQEWDKKQILG